jgi:fibro-slime domain-containing protein
VAVFWLAGCSQSATGAPGDGIITTPDGGVKTILDSGPQDSSTISTTDAGPDTGQVSCTSGATCYAVVDAGPYCGDKNVDTNLGEICDDGNKLSGDGCSATCKMVEPNFTCPPTGGPCTSTIKCGDTIRQAGEGCDDGNTVNGDGCSSACKLEAGWYCPTPGQPCQKNANCGDGKVTSGETCDDSNQTSGDGCDANCQTEPGYRCRPGAGCTKIAVCGDRAVAAGKEECDDGNTADLDGCSSLCKIEADYYTCPPTGGPCVDNSRCGNGKLEKLEQCDDGNTNGGDGCSSTCQAEPGYQCRMAGKPCVPLCGDRVITGTEQCDDGNEISSDGCSSTCLIEPGFACTTPGPSVCTKSYCGNAVVEAGENCDHGTANGLFYGDGSGCSKTCTKEPTCRTGGITGPCTQACGDGNKDVGEECDDGNQLSGDGCSADCKAERGFTCVDQSLSDAQPCPTNPALQCLVLPVTYRDFDSQQVAGGHPDFFYLSAPATGGRTTGVVPGAATTTCVPNASGIKLPWTPGLACPSSDATGPCLGIVQSALGPDGKPVLAKDSCPCVFTDWDMTGLLGSCTAGGCTAAIAGAQDCWVTNVGTHRLRIDTTVKVVQSAQTFAQWYTDVAGVNTTVRGMLELAQTGTQYQFSSSNGLTVYEDLHNIFLGLQTTLTSGFFPLDTQLPGTVGATPICNIWPYWAAGLTTACGAGAGYPVPTQWDPKGSYDRTLPTGTGGPIPGPGTLSLAVIGKQRNFYFTTEVRYLFRYDGVGGTLSFYGDDDVWVFVNGKLALDLGAPHERVQGQVLVNASYGLEAGKTYEVAIFHADRHPRESNYQLTLSGFTTTRSVCQPFCGDGVSTAGEECDNTTVGNTGEYGGCTAQCKFGPFCGDGVVNGPEECDDGRNTTVGSNVSGCGPGCKVPPRCGDGKLNPGEECDNGPNNQDGIYGGCNKSCQLNPFCGDGQTDTQWGEECDDGVNTGGYGYCEAGCKNGPRCGDSTTQPDYGEQCGVPGYCGDKAIQPELGEQCDLGTEGNTGAYGTCNPDCTLAPYCGDGVVQAEGGEKCDYGAANSPPDRATYGGCLVTCQLGPHCGDKILQSPDEQCDDGNQDDGDTCNNNCMIQVQIT